MLRDAKSDAPPPRYDVDDVVAAGRRRVHRRNAGWALAAVVAVAAAIGVPQVLTRGPGPGPTPAPAQSKPAVVVPTPARGEVIPLVRRFTGYQTATFRVEDPTSVGLGYTDAVVTRLGPRTNQNEFSGARLTVYEPGIDPVGRRTATARVDTDPIKGRPAFFFKSAVSTMRDENNESLAWEYADDGSLAVLTPDPYGVTRAELREVAEGFTMSAARPMLVPYKLRYVPAGYRLASITATDGYWGMGIVPLLDARAQLASGRDQAHEIIIWLDKLPDTSGGVRCGPDGCPGKNVFGGRYRFEFGTALPPSEVQKMINGAVMFSVDDPKTWIPVNEAVPEANQLKAE
ncbi:hypothetical protein MB27_05140 [Actinoplanes utahensis]|uniref:Uncharacterized protein n=2 Tax=Actinoplanes utahensis TaxID=1869 RepID=A0A0A6UR22_ACTUT|nr:hypothetical protein MB27_05140 [Actinoplanes utahensis]